MCVSFSSPLPYYIHIFTELSEVYTFKHSSYCCTLRFHAHKIRGYNQSEWIARGIAAVTGISIDTESVVRQKNTETQTRKSSFERWENVEGIFQLHHAEPLAGKHVLIVDDVLTTGATTVECASCLAEIEGIRISILTLAMAE